ncbi:EthD domain-containing protein [Halenospora varia]|nr:EthD domain-containing protein [Halenospora varia]
MSTIATHEKLIRVSVAVHRKPGTTEEEFNKYWAYKHGPLATEWLLRCGIVKYTQYHTTSEFKKFGDAMSAQTGRPMLEYDGFGDFYVRKYEDFENAFLDPEYMEKIRPDELRLIDMERIGVTVGVEYVVINEGKLVEKHGREF